MGNISSCCLPNKSDEDGVNERTHILDNPIASPEDSRYSSSPSAMSPTSYGTVSNGGRNEQNQLNNTLHKLVAKVIDVSSIDNNLEQSDWNERQRLYVQRLNNIRGNRLVLTSKYKSANNINTNVPNNSVNRNLSSTDPISEEDVRLINYFSEKSSEAIRNGFQIKCEESCVVQFDP